MGQTTYYDIGALPQGVPGQILDLAHAVVESWYQAESSAQIPFGVMVKKGTNDFDAKLPTASGDTLVGVVAHSHAYPTDFGSFAQGNKPGAGLEPGTTLSILRRGRIWVVTEQAVVQGDGAFVRYAANGGNTQLGAFRKDADTSNAVDVSKKVKFLKSQSTAGGLVPVDVDMLNS